MSYKNKPAFGAVGHALVPLAMAFTLVACGGSSPSQRDQNEGATRIGTHAVFDPITRQLPLNTDIIFAAAAGSDGTADVGMPTNPVEAAVNKLDGFSTNAYFDIAFARGLVNPGTLDPSSLCTLTDAQIKQACAAPNVYLLPLNTGEGDALDPGAIVLEDPFRLDAITPYTASVESLNGGENNILRVIPEAPLQPKTKYLVFVTDGVTDIAGESITQPPSFKALIDDVDVLPDLQALRPLVRAWNTLASGFVAASQPPVEDGAEAPTPPNVTFAYTFTTTDPQASLVAMAAPRAALVKAQTDMGVPAENAVAGANGLEAAGLLSTPRARPLAISPQTEVDPGVITGGLVDPNIARIYTGFIELPYYLTGPEMEFDPSLLQQSWTADDVLGRQLADALGLPEDALPPRDVDGSLNVTYRYPFAKQTGVEQVPIQLTLPNPDTAPPALQPSAADVVDGVLPGTGGLLGGLTEILPIPLDDLVDGVATCGALRDGLSEEQFGLGYPTVIFVHGITLDRSAALALSHTLASVCVATVAIDLPMHGVPGNSDFLDVFNVEQSQLFDFSALYPEAPNLRERHFNLVQDANGSPVPMQFGDMATELDGSGAWFINLGNLLNVRDNLRQGVVDLLNLNASLSAINELGGFEDNNQLNLNKVTVVGASLGGIVGTVFASVNEQAIAAEQAIGRSSALNPLSGFVMSVGGSQLSQVLNASPMIGPRVRAGLAAAGVEAGTSNFESFLYVAQSTVDSGDPVNFASSLADAGVPTLVQQIAGGGDASILNDNKVYRTDQVVPNSVNGAPLAGTTPLANMLNAQAVQGPGEFDANEQNLFVSLTIGHHGSLLRPNEEADEPATPGELLAITELQTQVATMSLSGAEIVQVGTAPDGEGVSSNFIEGPGDE